MNGRVLAVDPPATTVASTPVVLPEITRTSTTADRLNAAANAASIGVMIGYWVAFFTRDSVRTSDDPGWEDFERAFPLADAYLAAVGLAASRAMWRGQPAAVGLGIAGGSASVFVGLMDILYNVQHGKYAERSPQMALEVFFNVAAPGLGALTMVRMWRARHRLLT